VSVLSKRVERVKRLRWAILAAFGGAQLGGTSCGGKSSSQIGDSPGGTHPTGGSGGAVGGTGGAFNVTGGVGGSVMSGGGGRSATGGIGGGAQGGLGGAGNAGSAGRANPLACDDPRPYSSNLVSCNGSFVHRPAPTACPVTPFDPELGTGGDGAGGDGAGGQLGRTCSGDCPSGEHCLRTLDTEPGDDASCHRLCTTDSDCRSDELCACVGGILAGFEQGLPSGICLPATCRQDSDCGPDFLCVAAFEQSDCVAVPHAFHCQSAADECTDDFDCGADDCTFDGTRYRCEFPEVCGRPFLVNGELRRAPVISEGGWSERGAVSDLSTLPESVRAALAAHFSEAASMEHASIAAFARFTLELLALGAPASLVESAARAMADEVRHARLCFGLAERYSGKPVAPGPLSVDGALSDVELLRTVELAVLEGCIGETSAALEAAWAADAATDPRVRDVLLAIAEDEARHASLAFEFVAWAATRDARVPALVEHLVRDALAKDATAHPPRAPSPFSPALTAHGVLSAEDRRAARSAVLCEIVAALTPLCWGEQRPLRARTPPQLAAAPGAAPRPWAVA
jgi:hypothetical protein